MALALLCAACGDPADPMRPSGVMAEVSENIHTVVTVRWTTAVETIGYVEFGPTHEMTFHTPIEAAPAKDHKATLLGVQSLFVVAKLSKERQQRIELAVNITNDVD